MYAGIRQGTHSDAGIIEGCEGYPMRHPLVRGALVYGYGMESQRGRILLV